MKKLLLSIAGLLVLSLASTAQTITIGQMTPQIGDAYTLADCDHFSSGAAGSNQTWNLSGLTANETNIFTITNPAGLPGADNFPNASFASVITGQQAIGYSNVVANRIETLGMYSPQGLTIYADPITEFEFPLSYQSTYADSFERSTDMGGGTIVKETGDVSVLVDGAGTLITPAGTFTDVLRLKYDIESQVLFIVDGVVYANTPVTSTTYYFIKSGYSAPLARATSSLSSGQTIESATYYVGSTVGLDKLSPVNDLTIYPVPVLNDFTVNMDLKTSAEVTFYLFSIDGRMIAQLGKGFLSAGDNTRALSLPENTASGVYLLQIQTPESTLTKKIVVQ